MTNKTIIDTCGLLCPQPILMVNPYLTAKDIVPLEVLVDNKASLENVSRAAQTNGWKVEVTDINDKVKSLLLTL